MSKFSELTETEYLYGVKVEEFMYLRYDKALAFRLKEGKKLYGELYYLENKDFDDEVREFKVDKAVKHNEKLLSEITNKNFFMFVTASITYFCDIVIHTIGKLEESPRTAKKLFGFKKGNI